MEYSTGPLSSRAHGKIDLRPRGFYYTFHLTQRRTTALTRPAYLQNRPGAVAQVSPHGNPVCLAQSSGGLTTRTLMHSTNRITGVTSWNEWSNLFRDGIHALSLEVRDFSCRQFQPIIIPSYEIDHLPKSDFEEDICVLLHNSKLDFEKDLILLGFFLQNCC